MNNGENMKKIFISDLAEGMQLQDFFLVSKKTYAETKAGKPYLALTLMDNSGEIEARVWDDARRYNEIIASGTVIHVQAIAKQYREQLQLTVNSLQPVNQDALDLHHFMPSAKRSAQDMKTELFQIIRLVKSPQIKELLNNIFKEELVRQFLLAPAAKKMHHAYLGGLAEHTLSVTGLARKISAHYAALDADLLTAGALLHDIGKIEEFDYSRAPFEYTDQGRLIGHLVLGGEMVRKEAAAIANFPADVLDRIVHLILSHHGRYEFGSPCLPMTAEAILLHHLDDIDAKMNYIAKLSCALEGDGYQWSDYQRPLERFLLLRGQDGEDMPQAHPEEIRDEAQKDSSPEKQKKTGFGTPKQPPLF